MSQFSLSENVPQYHHGGLRIDLGPVATQRRQQRRSPRPPPPPSPAISRAPSGQAPPMIQAPLAPPPTRPTHPPAPRVRIAARTDTIYDRTAGVLTSVIELPGVRKNANDVNVYLSTCPWNRARQVTVKAIKRPPVGLELLENAPFGEDNWQDNYSVRRESRYGEYYRSFVVPQNTQVSIHIPCSIALCVSILPSYLSLCHPLVPS